MAALGHEPFGSEQLGSEPLGIEREAEMLRVELLRGLMEFTVEALSLIREKVFRGYPKSLMADVIKLFFIPKWASSDYLIFVV